MPRFACWGGWGVFAQSTELDGWKKQPMGSASPPAAWEWMWLQPSVGVLRLRAAFSVAWFWVHTSPYDAAEVAKSLLDLSALQKRDLVES